jgi:hypothetical protein
LSEKRESVKIHGMVGDSTHVVFLLLEVVNAPYGEGG